MNQWEHRVISPLSASHPELGRWLWAMEDTRDRTIRDLEGATQDELDWTAPGVENSIGSLLYHMALIEFDYLYVDIFGDEYPDGFEETLPFPDRDNEGHLSAVAGVTLEEHLARLGMVRHQFLARVSQLSAEALAAARQLPGWNYEISPGWTMHHLMQHEAEHRGQIAAIRSMYQTQAAG